jgi:hypothetical protein
MIYKGTSVSLWLMLGFGALLGLALVYGIAVALLYALPFLGALLWYLWWLDHGKSGLPACSVADRRSATAIGDLAPFAELTRHRAA